LFLQVQNLLTIVDGRTGDLIRPLVIDLQLVVEAGEGLTDVGQ